MRVRAPFPAEIVVDASALDTGHRGRGIGRYVAALTSALRDLDPAVATLRLSDRSDAWSADLPRRHFPRFLRSRRSLGPELAAAGCRVFGATEPWTLPTSHDLAVVPTCHDVIPLEFPDEYGGWTHAKWKAYFAWIRARNILGRAPAIIAPSRATRQALSVHLGVDPERVHVIGHGVDHDRFHPPDEEAVAGARSAANLGAEPYLLYVGGYDYRKNIGAVIEAFAASGMSADVLLLLGGSPGEHGDALLDRASDLGVLSRTVWCGRIPDARLPGLLGGALGFVYPSLSEGFGLQVLEAMAAGCPVVTSDRGALREVAGDAALLVDPTSVPAIADALVRLGEESTRSRLRAAGLQRARRYDWARTARETLDVYRSVAD